MKTLSNCINLHDGYVIFIQNVHAHVQAINLGYSE